MFRFAIAGAISSYQRHLSPHKGFCCAHRVLHGGLSCSEFGRRVVLRHGVGPFLSLLFRRFSRCARAYSTLQIQHQNDEKQYSDLPLKECLNGKDVVREAACCCLTVFPW
jgi:putative component of membrane protein insertase Oxa1/YidC/SpoIIIJ protein YidD